MTLFDAENIIYTQKGEEGAANCMRIPNNLLVQEQYPQDSRFARTFCGRATASSFHLLETTEFAKGDGCTYLLYRFYGRILLVSFIYQNYY